MTNQTISAIAPKVTSPLRIKLLEPDLKQSKNYQQDSHQFLSSLNEFKLVPSEELRTLAHSCRFATYEPGQYIKIEGEQERSYGFIVVSGLIAMTKTSIHGKELIVEILQQNDIFGLLLMLAVEKLPTQLSARSLHKSKLLLVPISNFTNMLKTQPMLFKEFVAHLLISLQSSYGLSRGLAHDRVEVRIAAILCSLTLKFTKPCSPDVCCTLKLTRQQIANLTGTTPETAIRVTRAMQRDGLIDISHPGEINVLDMKALQALVED